MAFRAILIVGAAVWVPILPWWASVACIPGAVIWWRFFDPTAW